MPTRRRRREPWTKTTVWLPTRIHRQARYEAFVRDETLTELVRRAVVHELKIRKRNRDGYEANQGWWDHVRSLRAQSSARGE